MIPKFRPHRARSPSDLDEAYALAPATPDVPLRQSAEANERQSVLFQELQHRVANTLHSMAATLEVARGKINSAPAEAGRILDRAMRRIALIVRYASLPEQPYTVRQGIWFDAERRCGNGD